MNMVSEVVEEAGPPPVMIKGCAKRLKEAMVLMMMTNANTLRNCGSVMKKNVRKGPAPSIAAASTVACGIWMRPA